MAAPRKRLKSVPKTAGQLLVEDLTEKNDPYRVTVMIIEAGRIADRLEKLDAVVAGEQNAWLRLCEGRDGDLEVRVDNALAEARQQATILRHLIVEIARQRATRGPEPGDDDLAGL